MTTKEPNPPPSDWFPVSSHTAVIDEDIRGWADEHDEDLKRHYSSILTAGQNGDLPELSSDPLIAAYCKKEKCDLFTGDKKFYIDYFDTDVQTIQITDYGFWETGKKPIFLITMIE
jgi:hypothetical protein